MYDYAKSANLSARPGFYFVCGDSESESMAADMHKMALLIHSKGIDESDSHEVIIPGAHHNEKQWNGDFPGFYKWLVKKSESP